MSQTTLNLKTAPGYEILAAVGKTVLRPGGRAATAQLWEWANFQPDRTVLELASGLGNSAIDLAKRYHVRVVGIEKDVDRVAIANANARTAGLADRVRFVRGNIFELEAIAESFDYVLAEAILTMQSPAGKAKILTGVRDRLKIGGKFLSHELLARDNLETLREDLIQATRVNATPLSAIDWNETFDRAGLAVTQQQTGAMRLLDPVQVLQDEGVAGTAHIIWNVATQPAIRDRIVRMRQVFTQHHQDLGYIISCTVRGSA